MRVHFMSDLHIEFGKMPKTYARPDCDVVVLAGDIGTGKLAFPWIEKTFRDVPVVYVAGNHEFYNRELHEHLRDMRDRAASIPNLHFLQNDSIVIDGVRFIGATLWTDFNLLGNPYLGMYEVSRNLNDYEQIKVAPKMLLNPEMVLDEHRMSRQFIVDELSCSVEKTVVVTHHAPCELSISDKYTHDSLSVAYASRLADVMLDFNPALWIHGHIHDSVDYEIGNTRVVCNPRGYTGHHLNPGFDDRRVVVI
jgi:Icc-related predicted phosphoesterase